MARGTTEESNGTRYPARLEGGALMREGAKASLSNVNALLKAERKLLPANILLAVGGLAGVAAQMAVREVLVDSGEKTEEEAFEIHTTSDGRRWFAGPQILAPIVEGKLSLWRMALHTAVNLGAERHPDLRAIPPRLNERFSSPDYGVAPVPAEHRPTIRMLPFLKANWARFDRQARRCISEPIELPVFFGFMAQEALTLTQPDLPPEIGLTILMESALAWSRLDPAGLSQA
jgi:hypothetical protein